MGEIAIYYVLILMRVWSPFYYFSQVTVNRVFMIEAP